jgi:hypothetical protein
MYWVRMPAHVGAYGSGHSERMMRVVRSKKIWPFTRELCKAIWFRTGMLRTSFRRLTLRHVMIFSALALHFFSLTMAAAEQSYIVKKNDTLSGIARKHGLSVAELARRNGLARDTKVRIGQRLRIPGQSSPPAGTVLNSGIERAIAGAEVKRGRWKYIVIHHSGVDSGTVKGMDQYHRKVRHMENGLAYHFVIGNGDGMGDGEVAAGRRWAEQLAGGHLASESQNKVALGICLVGNFDKDKPTAKQMRNLEALVAALLDRCNLSARAVKTHQQINVIHTRCPGRNFPARAFLKELRERRK